MLSLYKLIYKTIHHLYKGETMIYCSLCKRKIKLDEMKDILELTLGYIEKGRFMGCEKKYLHAKCSILDDSEIYNPTSS